MSRFAFIMDPLSTVIPSKDTSYAFMRAAQDCGASVDYVAVNDVSFREGRVQLTALEVTIHPDVDYPFEHGEITVRDSSEYTAIFVRPDPPFDSRYLLLTQLLDHAHTTVLNAPRGLQSVGEKMWALSLQDYTPKTVITSSKRMFKDVLQDWGKVVIKPADGYGGSGIFILERDGQNAGVAFETISENGAKPVVIQEYLDDALNGDKRVLCFDGEILGAVRRQHGKDDHRNNIAAGGTTLPDSLTDKERVITEAILPDLLELGIRFVGLDFIGEKLIEVNVTSPTCLQELSRFEKRDFAKEIVTKLMA